MSTQAAAAHRIASKPQFRTFAAWEVFFARHMSVQKIAFIFFRRLRAAKLCEAFFTS